ncbi:hypothetical protein [Evansella tamaricis]|uniref:Uncharacterized protein n=1 Tax=Evansella tamaricis TaxID=2069301 RepID=A0ABS6JE38_9BACI|nr:hypothetical protein [Evansella tamaricis]MBU9711942.1 hypothetical protein [Evansella tamaricis]
MHHLLSFVQFILSIFLLGCSTENYQQIGNTEFKEFYESQTHVEFKGGEHKVVYPPEIGIEVSGVKYKLFIGDVSWFYDGEETFYYYTMSGAFQYPWLFEAYGIKPIEVSAGTELTFLYEYKPEKYRYILWEHKDSSNIKELVELSLIVPEERGTYYYSLQVHWLNEIPDQLSINHVNYYFSLEVD